MVWAYLARATNDPAAADDLLQEAYYRLLRATVVFDTDDHRKNYLFRIATNLIRDRFRRPGDCRRAWFEDGEHQAAPRI